jgi:glycosyltransferase involved in cell wall biosynthesis
MPHSLSIIMPCYNCADTVEEAFDSISQQDFSIPYEVVMVNDGSTDRTATVLRKLAKGNKQLKIIQHPRNLGGGAARNTGIAHSKGSLIYCLDSDNILPLNSLAQLVDFLLAKKCDGVGFHHRKFFSGSSQNFARTVSNPIVNRPIKLKDFFAKESTLLDNFLFTRKAFLKTKGYPTHHGFDTQCFEIRFIAAKNLVWICPNSLFLHRQFPQQGKSYFERVYDNGEFSKNMYLIYEDIMPMFSAKVRKTIAQFDIFKNTSLEKQNLPATLQKMYKANPSGFFQKRRKRTTGRRNEDIFCRAITLYQQQKYDRALKEVRYVIQHGWDWVVPNYLMVRCLMGFFGLFPAEQIEANVTRFSSQFIPQPVPALRKNIFSLIMSKLLRILGIKRSK